MVFPCNRLKTTVKFKIYKAFTLHDDNNELEPAERLYIGPTGDSSNGVLHTKLHMCQYRSEHPGLQSSLRGENSVLALSIYSYLFHGSASDISL